LSISELDYQAIKFVVKKFFPIFAQHKLTTMKTPILIILAISFIVSCESPQTEENGNEQQQEREQKQTKKAQTKVKDDDRVSGYFDLKLDGVSYKSTQLKDNYCDMTFFYKGEKSFVTIRFRDVETFDALLVNIYGDEDVIVNPSGTIEDFMFSQADTKVNIQLLPGDGKESMHSISMVEGSLNISKFAKGQIKATFEGKGGGPKDAVTKENLLPFSGTIELNTENVMEMGKDKNEGSD
jgi:hypothetical protein